MNLPDGHSHALGGYAVRWEAEPLRFTVESLAASGRSAHVLWASSAGVPFVAAAAARSRVVDTRGCFTVRDRVLGACLQQRVDRVYVRRDAERRAVHFEGSFGDAGCGNASWSLRLAADLDEEVGRVRPLLFELGVAGHAGSAELNRAQLRLHLGGAPAVWGVGAQFTHFNLRGHCVPAFVSEQGIGRAIPFAHHSTWRGQRLMTWLLNAFGGGAGGNAYTTYASSASFTTSAGAGLVLSSSELALFDFGSGGCAPSLLRGGSFGGTGTSRDALAITVHARSMRGRMLAPVRAAASGGRAVGDFPAADLPEGAGHRGGGFQTESQPLRLLEALSLHTGRQSPLPEWTDDGVILGVQGGSNKVLQVVEMVRAAGVPLAAVWLQDWVGKRRTTAGDRLWWNWVLDDHPEAGSYASWDAMRAALAPVRVLTYINNFLSDPRSSGTDPTVAMLHLLADTTETSQGGMRARRNLFQEALEAGHLVIEHGKPYLVGSVGFEAALLDLTSARAREWVKAVVRSELIDRAGSSGWMADFGEALPCEGIRLHSGGDACAAHNSYAVEWAQLHREAIAEAGIDGFFFSRSAYTTSPAASPLFWLGDQLTTWDEHDGMASALTGMLSSGMSGFALTHSDVGGYTGVRLPVVGATVVRSRELLWRWAEMNALGGAVFRTHEGLLPQENHQPWSDAETLQLFRRCALLFSVFRASRRRLMAEAAARGWPLVRHPVVHHPADAVLVADAEVEAGGGGRVRQFMLGGEWMVLPVLRPGADRVCGYFPRGRWLSLWGQETLHVVGAGRWETVASPPGYPAVYVRA